LQHTAHTQQPSSVNNRGYCRSCCDRHILLAAHPRPIRPCELIRKAPYGASALYSSTADGLIVPYNLLLRIRPLPSNDSRLRSNLAFVFHHYACFLQRLRWRAAGVDDSSFPPSLASAEATGAAPSSNGLSTGLLPSTAKPRPGTLPQGLGRPEPHKTTTCSLPSLSQNVIIVEFAELAPGY